MPPVSILIPCYNAERWIAAAIESALAQTHPEVEVLVVDDGSKDGSPDIIRGFGDCIRPFFQENAGGNSARNRLLREARGEWLQYLDADDYLLPEKVAEQLKFIEGLEKKPDVLFSPTIVEFLHEGETENERDIIPINPPYDDPWVQLARWDLPQTGGPLWRRAALESVEGWNEDWPCCQEHELYLRLLEAGKTFAYCPHAHAVYRHWSEGTVSFGNVPEVQKRRLIVLERIEKYLTNKNGYTDERRYAVEQLRFDIARTEWERDAQLSKKLIAEIQRRSPDFEPSGPAAPKFFKLTYRTVGYSAAERIAKLKRTLTGN